jgi:ribosomal protein S18 acetylase RimI-like enzyme
MSKISLPEKTVKPSERRCETKMKINIRRAGASDAEQLTRLARASKKHWKYPASWLAARREDLVITPDFVFWNDVFAATIDGVIVGFYALVSEKGRSRLEHLWIEPEFTGQEIGRRLLRHAVWRAFESNAESIEIVSDPHAEEFYKKAGATRIGEEVAEIECERRILPRLEIKTGRLRATMRD